MCNESRLDYESLLEQKIQFRDELLKACDLLLSKHLIGINCHGPRLDDKTVALLDLWREETFPHENSNAGRLV